MTRPGVLAATVLVFIAGIAGIVAVSPSACQAKTIRNKTIFNVKIPAGAHDRTYVNVVFKGSRDTIVKIPAGCHNITFRRCIFASGGANGVKILDRSGTVHDITFVRCRFRRQPRVAFACVSKGSKKACFRNIKLVKCVVEPAGEDAIRLTGPSVASGCVIDRCTIQGAGARSEAESGYAVKINGPLKVRVSNTRIYATRRGAFDLTARAGSARCGWSFENDTIDFTRRLQKRGTDRSSARLIRASGMNGSVWDECTFTTGDASNHVLSAGSWSSSSNNDLSSSTITGVTGGQTYWSMDAGCLNNRMPRVRKATITGLSLSSARVGNTLTIRGRDFGAAQGRSTVTFGERPNVLGFAPCASQAAVVAWRDTSITVRVPSMAPGSHPVYVSVGGLISNAFPFEVNAVTVIRNRTFATSSSSGYIPRSQHDVLYEGCTFTATNPRISGTLSGVLCLGQNSTRHYNITFRNCTFTGNTGVGSGNDYGVNGIKLVNVGDTVHDITFEGCRIGAMSRMGFEAVRVGKTSGLRRIAILGCSFEPCGAEPISFNGGDLYSLVDGCVLKGSGNLSGKYNGWSLPQYIGSFEVNGGRYVEVRNTDFWACNGAALNLSGVVGTNRYLLFDHITIDFSHTYQAVPTSYSSRVFNFQRMSYVRLKDCTINTGSPTNCVYNAGWANNDNGVSWSGCTYNDFSGSTITGYVNANSPHMPTSAAAYWDSQANQTNDWPTVVR